MTTYGFDHLWILTAWRSGQGFSPAIRLSPAGVAAMTGDGALCDADGRVREGEWREGGRERMRHTEGDGEG